jgi:hypothetical protein
VLSVYFYFIFIYFEGRRMLGGRHACRDVERETTGLHGNGITPYLDLERWYLEFFVVFGCGGHRKRRVDFGCGLPRLHCRFGNLSLLLEERLFLAIKKRVHGKSTE